MLIPKSALAAFCFALISSIAASPAAAQNVIKLSTTTSTEASGLLKFLLPVV